MKILVFGKIMMSPTFLDMGGKFFRWDKNSLSGVKMHQAGTSETVKEAEKLFFKSKIWKPKISSFMIKKP